MTNDGRGRWLGAAAAGVATLIALVAGVLVANRSTGTPEQSGAPVVTAGADPAGLVVDDGDLVEASGQVIVAPGRPARFCAPAPVAAIGRTDDAPPECALGIDLTGVDAARLSDRSLVKGVTVGQARLRGTWRAGTLQVTDQGPPAAAAPTGFDDSVPCPAPKGGWKPGGYVDSNAMHEYVYDRHPDRFRPFWVGHPDGLPTGPTTGPQPAEVMVVEVVAGDPAKEEQQLRKLYTGNLCVVSAPGRPSLARQQQLRDQVTAAMDPVMTDPANGIFSFGGDDVFTVELMMLTPRLYDRFAAIGFDLLRLEPWLRPTV